MHLNIFHNSYIHALRMKGYSRHTISAYRNALGRFSGGPKDFDRYIEFLASVSQEDFSFSTRNIHICALMGCVKWMQMHDQSRFSQQQMAKLEEFAKFVRGKPKKSTIVEDHMPDAQKILERAQQIVAETHGNKRFKKKNALRNAAMVEILLSSGMRISELLALRPCDLDRANKTVKIFNGKGQKSRVSFFNSPSLAEYRKYYRPGRQDRLFPISANGFRAVLRSLADDVGVKNFSPHSFRHAFATTLLSKTGNLALVQELLGHADPKTTRIYAHVLEKDAMELWGEVFDNEV